MLSTKNGAQPSRSASTAARGRQHVEPDGRQRRQQRVLRRGEVAAAQARQVGDKRRRGHAAGQVLAADRHAPASPTSCPAQTCIAYIRFDSACSAPQTSSARNTPIRGHQDAAERDAGQGRDHAVDLGDRRHLDLGKAERDVKRVRHRPGQRVAEFVEHDEQDDRARAAPRRCAGTVDERRDHRARAASPRPAPPRWRRAAARAAGCRRAPG